MAWFSYHCKEHGDFKVSLDKREKTQKCPTCFKDSCAIIKRVGNAQIVDRLDNGAMVRAVERLQDIEEIMEERSNKDTQDRRKRMGLEDEE